jgi:hypothetical protein
MGLAGGGRCYTFAARARYLAVSESVWRTVFTDALGEILVDDRILRVVTFDPMKEELVRWIP